MKLYMVCFLFLSGPFFGDAQLSFNKQWDKRFGGIKDDALISFTQANGDGYLLGGASNSPISGDKTQDNWDTTLYNADAWLIKTDSLGNKKWDKRFGWVFGENSIQLLQTFDGGYISGGISNSDSGGDKSQNSRGGYDYWIVKIDSAGNKQWDRRFGGSGNDNFTSMEETRDSGYILGGMSDSQLSGDKTQDNWTIGTYDYWIVKVDKYGNKEWDKRFGGTSSQFPGFFAIKQAKDGGYIFGGYSESDTGGDKTQANWGEYNYWVVKMDSVGNKMWDHVYGGTVADYLASIVVAPDGGFLLGGYSYSGISGNKTTPLIGAADYWVVKTDSAGNILWEKDYGGTIGGSELYTAYLTADHGYLLAGGSNSPIGGNKTENNLGPGQIWIVKTDSLGNQQWDKTIFTDSSISNIFVIQTLDGCYMAGCATQSTVGGYKTQPNWNTVPMNETDDYWVIKFCMDSVLDIEKLPGALQLNIYPIPFASDLNINLALQGLKQATFTIKNMLGQTVYNQTENNLSDNYTKMLDLSYLPNGIYLVEVMIDGKRIFKEVVKQ